MRHSGLLTGQRIPQNITVYCHNHQFCDQNNNNNKSVSLPIISAHMFDE